MKFRLMTTFMIIICPVQVLAQDDSVLDLPCLLEPYMTVNVGTPVAGVLSSVDVKRGDVVTKNGVLAQIDSRAESAAMDLSRARVDFAERRIVRNEELFKDGLISTQERDELLTESQLAKLELVERKVQLEIRTIRSPVSGVIVERVRSPGEFVQETEILKLAQIDPLNVEVIVPVKYFGKIKSGQMAVVKPQAPVNGVHKAKVKVIDKVIDAASGTFRVRLSIPNRGLKIPAGLSCQVEFTFD